jgi:LysM repeat protein
MAAKKPAKPRKFKQARKDAKSAAKQTFSGKSQARLKDVTGKLTTDDKLALQEMKTTAKAELGSKAYLDPKEYKATQEAAREKFRAGMREEGLYPEKKSAAPAKASVKKKAPAKKAAVKPDAPKPTVNKPATKGFAAGKTLNATGQARYDELIKQGIKPKSAMNKALFAQEKATKPAAKKPATNTSGMTARQEAALQRRVGKTERKSAKLRAADPVKYDAREKAATNPKLSSMQKVEEIRKVGATTKPKPAEKPKSGKFSDMQAKKNAAKTPKYVVSTRTNAPGELASTAKASEAKAATKKKFGKTKAVGKGLLYTALAAEVVSAAKGTSEKDFKEIQRLENKLAGLQGKAPKYKNMGSNKNPVSVLKTDAGNFAALASMGAVGKTRRTRMDELNAKIEKAQAKKNKTIAKNRAAKPGVSAPGRSSSKINKTFKQAASGAPSVGAGGSTITPGSGYRVKRGDTLSGIAKTAGVSLSDIMSANEKFKKDAKYKGGNMIFANTKVNIPKKK